jgi:hypothetical protein
VSTPTSSRDINELADDLGKVQISDLIRNSESEFGSNSAPIRDGSALQFQFGLHNTFTVYQEMMQSESFSTLEKDLDDLLQLGAVKKGQATTSREAPICDDYWDSNDDVEPLLGGHQGLTITQTPRDRLVS